MTRFAAGRRFKSRGQRYDILGTRDHWTRDDRYVQMIRYQSVCAEPGCNRIFVAMTTKSRLRRGELNKRCEQHHAPGLPAPVKAPRRAAAKKAVFKKRPCAARRPAMSPEAREIARLAWRADLAVRRGQQPSFLD